MAPVRRRRAKHLAQRRIGGVRSGRQQTTDGHRRRRTATLVTAHPIKAPATLTIGVLAAVAVIGVAAVSAVLTVVAAHGTCADAGLEAAPSGAAKRAVPASYLSLYRLAGRGSGVPWTVLAAIGSIETDHGRSRAPGVRSRRQPPRLLRRPDAIQHARRATLDMGALRQRR
jgi:hypothetical protein